MNPDPRKSLYPRLYETQRTWKALLYAPVWMVLCAPDKGIDVMFIPLVLNLNPDWPCDHFPSQPWYSFQLQLPNCFLALQWSVNLQHFASFAHNSSTRGVTAWLPVSPEIFILGNKTWLPLGKCWRWLKTKIIEHRGGMGGGLFNVDITITSWSKEDRCIYCIWYRLTVLT